ncbi:TPA: hypothetical protein ACFP31_001872 [Neisseria subflava]|jgi:hypothetical protein
MGFSLYFYRFENGEQVDGNREGAKSFLNSRGLDSCLRDKDGNYLEFDNCSTDLEITDFNDRECQFEGNIGHAYLTDEECSFIYELCRAADWVIVNPQISDTEPLFILLEQDTAQHLPEEYSDNYTVISSGEELQMLLLNGFHQFQAWKSRIL